MRLALLIACLALPTVAAADAREVLYGTWGTPQQCAREPLGPGLTIRQEPFEIGAQWLKRGQIWCRLNWFPIEQRDDELFTGAFAQCGEDGVRDYFLRLNLAGDDLTIRWDFLVSNGPLARCPSS